MREAEGHRLLSEMRTCKLKWKRKQRGSHGEASDGKMKRVTTMENEARTWLGSLSSRTPLMVKEQMNFSGRQYEGKRQSKCEVVLGEQ